MIWTDYVLQENWRLHGCGNSKTWRILSKRTKRNKLQWSITSTTKITEGQTKKSNY